VVIDPGQGFGTGRHASTALALVLLEQCLEEGPRSTCLLDVGTGSGILALAACRLGVPEAWLMDIDGRVFPEVRHNFSLNALPPPRALIQGGAGCLRGHFGLVLANILADVLIADAEALAGLTADNGWLILSGILKAEREAVVHRYALLGMEPVAEASRDEWFACCLRRRP
jgi:ribosomal protein L11 methyltransferase